MDLQNKAKIVEEFHNWIMTNQYNVIYTMLNEYGKVYTRFIKLAKKEAYHFDMLISLGQAIQGYCNSTEESRNLYMANFKDIVSEAEHSTIFP
jgi:hypothetical protein